MNDNSTDSKLENMKLDDDTLEKVAGGKTADYTVVSSGMVPVYFLPNIWPNPESNPVAKVIPGVTLLNVIASCGYPGWLQVPIPGNKFKIVNFVKGKWGKDNQDWVYIEERYMREIK